MNLLISICFLNVFNYFIERKIKLCQQHDILQQKSLAAKRESVQRTEPNADCKAGSLEFNYFETIVKI